MSAGLDKIHIRDLRVRCIVGLRKIERVKKQDVFLSIDLHADLRKAGQTDALEETVDYSVLKKKIMGEIEESSFHLIEKVAERVAEICLEDSRVQKVNVTVDKPEGLRFARSVAVEIERERALK